MRTHPRLPILGISLLPLLLLGAYFVFNLEKTYIEESLGAPVEIPRTTFGQSTEERPIEGTVLGSGDRCLLIFGAIHGNEKGTKELMDLLIKKLVTHPELIHPNNKVIIIPLANPDGYLEREDKLNANEVNLNRNFATDDWVRFENPRDPETFAGDEPFSEVESRVFRDVAQNCNHGAMIAFHSQGSLVSPEANESSLALGAWYAQHTGYTYFTEWDYAGTATRWFAETKDLPAITIELSSHTKHDWHLNKSALLTLIGTDNIESLTATK